MKGNLLLQALLHPNNTFHELQQEQESELLGLARYPALLVLLPPVMAFIGASFFGWRLGAAEPLYFDSTSRVTISFAYFVALSFGFISTVFISAWMASTYGARTSLTLHLALFTVVCAPLSLASLMHLYPSVFLNVLVLIPAIAWSMTLLYRGLPIVLDIPPERGMLMSSAIVGWLLVGAVSLLGLSAALWTLGIGANVRI